MLHFILFILAFGVLAWIGLTLLSAALSLVLFIITGVFALFNRNSGP